jgi:hypothetical protein
MEVLLRCALHHMARLLPRRRLHQLHTFHQVFRCAARREGIIYDHLHGSDPVFTQLGICASV